MKSNYDDNRLSHLMDIICEISWWDRFIIFVRLTPDVRAFVKSRLQEHKTERRHSIASVPQQQQSFDHMGEELSRLIEKVQNNTSELPVALQLSIKNAMVGFESEKGKSS